jgi:DHA1 family tetracycline resistance protein-like MFS transporter
MGNKKVLFTLFAVVLVDLIGYTIVLPLLPFYSEHLGATPFVVGAIVSCFALAQMISGPILGRLSDHYGRKPILIISQIGTLLSFVFLALSTKLWMVFAARIVDGLTAGNIVVAQAYVADVTSREQRTKAMGLIGAAFGLGFVIGPSLSAFFSGYGTQAPLWVAAVMSMSAIIGSSFILKEPKRHAPPAGSQKMSRLQLIRSPGLLSPMISFFLFTFSFSMLISGMALFGERVLQWHGQPFGVREVGWIYTYGGLIGLVVQVVFIGKALRIGSEKSVALVSFAVAAAGFLVVGWSPSLVAFVVGYTFVQSGCSFVRPSLMGVISKCAPAHAQGLVFGTTQTLMALSQIIAPLVGGALIESGHYAGWAWTAGVVAALGCASMVFSQAEIKPSQAVA